MLLIVVQNTLHMAGLLTYRVKLELFIFFCLFYILKNNVTFISGNYWLGTITTTFETKMIRGATLGSEEDVHCSVYWHRSVNYFNFLIYDI